MKRLAVFLLYGALGAAVTGLGAYLAVSLVVERTPEVAVPDLVGAGLSEGLDRLAGTGLDLEVRGFVYSDDVPENHIVRQRPRPGQRVKAGRGVGVTLSRGPERHPVPDVRGVSLEDARILFEEAALAAEVAGRLPDGPEGTVVAQGVVPGTRLPRGARVPVLVSGGPPPVRLRMPRLEGRPLAEAIAALDRLGLRADRVEEVKLDDPRLQGRVVSQSPLAGFPAEAGGAVTLSVAGEVRPAARTRAVLFTHRLPPGFARHRVEVFIERAGRTWTLLDDWFQGGRVVRAWVPLQPGERATLRVDGVEIRSETG